ncbi:D-arabinono-1,4-lactone oxidase [Kocuria sp.]|uniref:D-arabinono-1,4-lactone oxidase n=1 Tax=Kocuria sp. TaxID=1871328 RepID=UPI0026DFC728|nr:D-arabinono-1,4-lactone oxidase [Kocuria sp.]MDO5617227.1 D-arabinono-1,4-lactone oxidase [Kocuria sp.]
MKKHAVSWRNWSGLEKCTSEEVVAVRTEEELRTTVACAVQSGRRLKAVGAGHSFSSIAVAPDIRLDLSSWSGVVATDQAQKRITVRSGTHLWEMPRILAPTGLAMQNLGDIDRQTVSGAISTGTHGTGLAFGGLASQVVGLRLLTGTGEELVVDESSPELLDALRVGLGAYGIITEVTLQLVDAFDLSVVEKVEPLADVMQTWEERCRQVDHFEFFWFGHSNRVVTKTSHRLAPGRQPHTSNRGVAAFVNDEILGNTVFDLACRVGARVPRSVPIMNEIATSVWHSPPRTRASHELFASPRRVRFAECEYALRLEDVPAALGEIRSVLRRKGMAVTFPVEVRCAAPDTAWLASNHGRPTGYIAVHQHRSADHRQYFAAVEAVHAVFGGRPHWGKVHRLAASELAELYPRFTDAVELRARLDPQQIFGNDYIDSVLGV